VSRWIWFGGKAKRPPHHSPVYLICGINFWIIWSLVIDSIKIGEYGDSIPMGTRIAMPLLVLAGVPFNLAFCWVWTIVFPPTEDSHDMNSDELEVHAQEKDDKLECEAIITTTDNDQVGKQEGQSDKQDEAPIRNNNAPSVKPNVIYINNIKIFLTNMVILHHVAEIILGQINLFTMISQSYFMALFFFYSGYFTPKSFDKRGTYVFIMDRAKRLGIPFVLITFFIGPYLHSQLLTLILYQRSDPVLFPVQPGVTWFLAQLLILCIVYAFACGKGWSPKISCPSLLGFLGISVVLGLVGGIGSVFLPDFLTVVPNGATVVMLAHNFWGQYFSYVVFFFGGAVAQRNNWMEAIKTKSRVVIYLWAILSTVGAVIFAYLANILGLGFAWDFGFGFFFGGLMTVSISLAVTVFFMDCVDKKYLFTNFFAKSMYTAYIIHHGIPIRTALKCWKLILEASGIESVDGNTILPYAGFLFTSAIALIIVWPLAYCIRSIPGFSQVL